MWTKALVTSLLVGLIRIGAAAQAYTVTDLGKLSPKAINTWGQVVGNYNNQGYIWSFGQMRAVGTLPGGTSSSAVAINDLGMVAGTADGRGTVVSMPGKPSETKECNDLSQPFVWTLTGGMKGLGGVGDPNYFPVWCELPFDASDINDSGRVVGFLAGSYNDTQWGFVWTKAQGMKLFGGSWVPTFAQAVNNSGEIVGQNSVNDSPGTTAFIGHATLWKSGVATDLGTLGGGPDVLDYASAANGVNDRGQVVGWSTTSPVSSAGSPVHAVIWSARTGTTDLGPLPGDTSSMALKINYFGQVIGTSGNSLYPFPFQQSLPFGVTGRPFIWSGNAGMRDLNDLIPANSGWVLHSASDINVWGQIVGSGTLNGKPHGFLLTPTAFW
jgi:probable HAF family extracellular repeat protein